MSLSDVFNIAGSAMNAQSVRLNVTASNLANAGSVNGDPSKVYKARQPVFESFSSELANQAGVTGVRLSGVVTSEVPLSVQYRPGHPDANAEGNVYLSNVNTVEEMVNMLSASRSYQNNIELMTTARDLLLQTLSLGR